MALFVTAFAYTLEREGGYVFTRYANDRGQGTFAGLTAKTVAAYIKKPVTDAMMQALTPTVVQAIYKQNYWDVILGDRLAQQVVAMALYDMSVLMGPQKAVALAQGVCGLVTDGVCGPKTVAGLGKVGVVAFVNKFTDLCDQYFHQIVARDATQAAWLSGWLKRTTLMDHITEI